MSIKYNKNRKMDQVSIHYTIIFHSKTLQNIPKFGFWFENKPSGNPTGGVVHIVLRSSLNFWATSVILKTDQSTIGEYPPNLVTLATSDLKPADC
jgi:hypothetical protein